MQDFGLETLDDLEEDGHVQDASKKRARLHVDGIFWSPILAL